MIDKISKRISPTLEERGQCEAERQYKYLLSFERKYPDKRCLNPASFVIEGKRFCARHAGIEALKIVLGEKKDD